MIARWCRALTFCETTIDHDAAVVIRRRRRGSTALVSLANLTLAAQRVNVRFLHERAWLDHESEIYASIGIAVRRIDANRLQLPLFPGRTLHDVLIDADTSPELRDAALSASVAALIALHNVGSSHGDAHVGNVIVCPSRLAAHWIDFETQHTADTPSTERFADDLRALVCSSLEYAPSCAASLARIIGAADLSPEIFSLLFEFVRRTTRSLYHQAQGDPSLATVAMFLDR